MFWSLRVQEHVRRKRISHYLIRYNIDITCNAQVSSNERDPADSQEIQSLPSSSYSAECNLDLITAQLQNEKQDDENSHNIDEGREDDSSRSSSIELDCGVSLETKEEDPKSGIGKLRASSCVYRVIKYSI